MKLSPVSTGLGTLVPGLRQWDAQSLCNEWKVRHVVGHLIVGADVKTGPFIAARYEARDHTR